MTIEGGGRKPIADLRPGERVLASADGGGNELIYSEVLTFLDRDPTTWRFFYSLHTEAGPQLTLTAAHLVFISEGNCTEGADPNSTSLRTVYASDAQPGQCVLVSGGVVGGAGASVHLSRVTRVELRKRRGAFAPLTQLGTLVVDGVLASCYAVLEQHNVAHRAFGPLRLAHRWGVASGRGQGGGVHWYPRLLHWLGRMLLDSRWLHPLGVAEDRR